MAAINTEDVPFAQAGTHSVDSRPQPHAIDANTGSSCARPAAEGGLPPAATTAELPRHAAPALLIFDIRDKVAFTPHARRAHNATPILPPEQLTGPVTLRHAGAVAEDCLLDVRDLIADDAAWADWSLAARVTRWCAAPPRQEGDESESEDEGEGAGQRAQPQQRQLQRRDE